jgi:hypothetical protein
MEHPEQIGAIGSTSTNARKTTLRLEPMTAEHLPAVQAFNERLEAGGGPPYRFSTTLPAEQPANGVELLPRNIMKTWLVLDGSDVRGGVLTQELEFDTESGRLPVINIQLPLSEGTVDRRFAHVGMWIIRRVQQMQQRVYAVGMGSADQPLPRLLQSLGWTVALVPFLFHVHRPSRFLREMPILRRNTPRRVVSSLLARSGIGTVAVAAATLLKTYRLTGFRHGRAVEVTRIESWDAWATEIWEMVHSRYSLSAVRDERALSTLYPPSDGRTICFRVDAEGQTVGWFAVLVTEMQNSRYFGSMRVGTVLDAQCLPGFSLEVIGAARETLHELGVDLSITNQLSAFWQHAFESSGYWRAPSNYVFAASPGLMRVAAGAADALTRAHVTRGDGDGRIHL